MHSRLTEEEKQILYYWQFGFKKDFPISHAILTLPESIQKALDDRLFASRIFIELDKANDIAIHDILILLWKTGSL